MAVVFGTLTTLVPRFISGYYLSEKDIGLFQAAYQLATLTTIILASFNAILAPLVSTLHRENIQRLNDVYIVSTKWGLYVSVPFFIIMVMFPAALLRIVFGSASGAGVTAFVILTVAQLVNTATGGIGTILVMSGLQKNWMTISSVAFVVVVLASLVFLPLWGLLGMAIVTAIGIVGMYVWAVVEGYRVLRLWPFDRRYWKGLLSGLIAFVVVLFYAMFIHGSDLLVLAGASVISFGVFALALCLFGLDAEDVNFLRAIKQRILKSKLEPTK